MTTLHKCLLFSNLNFSLQYSYDMLEVRALEEGERIAFLRMQLNWNSKKLSDKQVKAKY